MNVAELAKQLGTTSDDILKTLKSLKLKAKGSDQELSAAVASVVKSQYSKAKKTGTSKTAPSSVEDKTLKEDVKETSAKAVKPKAKSDDTDTAPKKKEEKPAKKAVSKETKKPAAAKAPEKAKSPKKKSAPKESLRDKLKITDAPVITLKPLVRKKRKAPGFPSKDEGKSDDSSQEHSASTGDVSSPSSASSTFTPGSVPSQAVERDEKLPDIEIHVPIIVKDFSVKVQQKPSAVLKELMKLGILANINQALDADIVSRLTKTFGFNLAKVRTQEEQVIDDHKQEDEDKESLTFRAPVVTFMGHVDHGKTSLLDRIRKSKIADLEHGGITQHIGAYSVTLERGRITFLDTPGHEAFTAMRARGAHITDIVVLVIAADEGIMPQTEEAIDHARAAGVPIVIALNKIDRKTANPDRVKKQLSEIGLMPEDWGGKTVVAGVSAVTGEGIDSLLEFILLEAELLELKANPNKKASGIVVEAHLSRGKGAVATLIVQSGTLHDGEYIVVGPHYGKIKALFDDHERPIKEAGPSMPVEILGLPDVPAAGEKFYIVDNEKVAREITQQKMEIIKNKKLQSTEKLTLEKLYSQIQEGAIKEFNVILKADVQGSLEALKDSLAKIPSDKVKLKFIHSAVGDVNASDVLLAAASSAIIIAFHVGISTKAKEELEKQPVDIREYRIIYDAVNDIRNALEGLLEPKYKKNVISKVEIREVFKLSKAGIVAGCYVTKGRVARKAKVDIRRNGDVVYTGAISSLKRFKDDVREVNEGMECGITVDNFTGYLAGDILEIFELESIAQRL